MFAGKRRYDAVALSLADSADDAIQRSSVLIDCGEGTQIAERKGLEL